MLKAEKDALGYRLKRALISAIDRNDEPPWKYHLISDFEGMHYVAFCGHAQKPGDAAWTNQNWLHHVPLFSAGYCEGCWTKFMDKLEADEL